jgi:hypothetical protein
MSDDMSPKWVVISCNGYGGEFGIGYSPTEAHEKWRQHGGRLKGFDVYLRQVVPERPWLPDGTEWEYDRITGVASWDTDKHSHLFIDDFGDVHSFHCKIAMTEVLQRSRSVGKLISVYDSMYCPKRKSEVSR